MKLTDLENSEWQKHAHFFEPNGVLDEEACQMYLQTHLRRDFYVNRMANGNAEVLLALLKKVPHLDESRNAFVRLYANMRKELPGLQPLMQEYSREHPETLRAWLKQASECSNMTSQILLIRDVKEWLPNDNVIDYISSALLSTKPATFVKRFSPDVPDMKPMLDAALDMQKDPQYAPLGLMIVQGIFTAMYGKESQSESSMELKYCAREAFQLLHHRNVRIAPGELLDMVVSRYKGPSIVSDALAFTYECLDAQDQETQARGLEVLDAVMEKFNQSASDIYIENFCRIHSAMVALNAPTLASWVAKIQDACCQYIASADSSELPARAIMVAAKYGPGLVEPMLDALLARNDDQDCTQLIAHVYLGGERGGDRTMYRGLNPYENGYPDSFVQACENRISPQQMTHAFIAESERLIQKYRDGQFRPEAEAYARHNALQHFSRQKTSPTMVSHLKESPVVAQWTLAYLGAQAVLETPTDADNGTMPELDHMPLPFLAKLYPEHAATWNTMQKALLQRDVNTAKNQTNVHQQLFDMFAQTFLPNAPTFLQAHGACLALDVNWQEYVATMCALAHAPMLENLAPALFEFSS